MFRITFIWFKLTGRYLAAETNVVSMKISASNRVLAQTGVKVMEGKRHYPSCHPLLWPLWIKEVTYRKIPAVSRNVHCKRAHRVTALMLAQLHFIHPCTSLFNYQNSTLPSCLSAYLLIFFLPLSILLYKFGSSEIISSRYRQRLHQAGTHVAKQNGGECARTGVGYITHWERLSSFFIYLFFFEFHQKTAVKCNTPRRGAHSSHLNHLMQDSSDERIAAPLLLKAVGYRHFFWDTQWITQMAAQIL